MPANDPMHARIGHEFINISTHDRFRFTPTGWMNLPREERWPAPSLESPPLLEWDDAADWVDNLLTDYERYAARYEHYKPETWDCTWATRHVGGLMMLECRFKPERFRAAVMAVVPAFESAVMSGDWRDKGQAFRCALRDLKWEMALHYPMLLTEMMKAAGDDMHGSCSVSFDGDCFEPPPWTAYVGGVLFKTFSGGGDTPEEALRRAMWVKDAYLRHPDRAVEAAKHNAEMDELLKGGLGVLEYGEHKEPA